RLFTGFRKPPSQRHGIAMLLMDAAEQFASAEYRCGVTVGLFHAYYPAQQLYDATLSGRPARMWPAKDLVSYQFDPYVSCRCGRWGGAPEPHLTDRGVGLSAGCGWAWG